MDAITKIFIFVIAIWLGVKLLRWAFPRLFQWWVKRMVRRQFGINVEEPKAKKRRRSFFSGGESKPKPRRQGKKIPRDVGEYVEFEEISVSYESHGTDGSHFKAEEQIVDVKWTDIK